MSTWTRSRSSFPTRKFTSVWGCFSSSLLPSHPLPVSSSLAELGWTHMARLLTWFHGHTELDQWFPTFFDGGPNLIFQVSWRPQRCRAPSVAFMTDDCVLLRRTCHRLKGSGKCTQRRVLNFTRRPPKSAPCSPPKPKSIRFGEPLLCSNLIFSLLLYHNPLQPTPHLNPRYVPFSFYYPSLR